MKKAIPNITGRFKMAIASVGGQGYSKSFGALSPYAVIGVAHVPAQQKALLAGDLGGGWRLSRPIVMNIEQDEDGEYLVTDSFSTVYGDGDTLEKAVRDYCNSLIEYYELLSVHANDNVQTAMLFSSFRQYLYNAAAGAALPMHGLDAVYHGGSSGRWMSGATLRPTDVVTGRAKMQRMSAW